MKIHHLRNATCIIETGGHNLLIDPMLCGKGELPPFAWLRHKAQRNPTVSLPDNAIDGLDKVTHCLVTHSQTYGIKALQHSDHLDHAGEAFLRKRAIPVTTGLKDAAYLKRYGLNVVGALPYWKPTPLLDGEITAIPARHGHGWIRHLMANGAGFLLRFPGEPSIYVSGDTVYTRDVEKVLLELKPDVSIVACGSASLDLGAPILMPLQEILTFVRRAPGKVIANHLDALNHCPTTRAALKNALESNGWLSKVSIPLDGETIVL